MSYKDKIESIEDHARLIRINTLKMINKAGSGHPGGSLSCADILATLYFPKDDSLMSIKVCEKPAKSAPERDRLVLSKGHAAPALYSALALRGFFKIQRPLKSLRKIGSEFQGHVVSKVPGIDASTGGLGQGLSIAAGMALGAKIGEKNGIFKRKFKVYCILGDGECQEGQVMEAASFAGTNRLNNLVVFVDGNDLQIMGRVAERNIMNLFKDNGWNASKIDGHNVSTLLSNINWKYPRKEDRPLALICKTVKGKGVSFMENKIEWHGKAPNDEELEKALAELVKKPKDSKEITSLWGER